MKYLLMKRIFLLLALVIIGNAARAQYYYRDILLTNQNTRQINLYKNLSVRNITVKSYDARDLQEPAITATQTINKDFTEMVTITKSVIGGNSELRVTYSAGGRPVKSVDTTEGYRSETFYEYDENNRVKKISNTSYSPGGVTDTEVHEWYYDEDGAPEKMLKIRNFTDTTVVTFELDEEGRIGEEKAVRNGKPLPTFYYYYDSGNRITDIVRYNERAKRLLPDNMFEYNEAGRMSAMIVVPEGSTDYQRWVYDYLDNGLKIRERCFDKNRQQLAVVNYSYDK